MEAVGPEDAPRADPRLMKWLSDHHVEHELHRHPATMSAVATARAERVDPRTFAKTVVVAATEGQRAIFALEATDRVDLKKAARALGATAAHLVSELGVVESAPDDDPGAWPPVGELFGLPVVADRALRDVEELSFSAGSYEYAVRVDRAAWEEAANVRYADIAEDRSDLPAWER